MKLVRFDRKMARAITAFDSRFGITPVMRASQRVQIGCAHLPADGLIGRHQATIPQLFLVVAGKGWVTGAEGEKTPIATGQAAFWAAGEWHETTTEKGLTAIIVEGEDVSPAMMTALAKT